MLNEIGNEIKRACMAFFEIGVNCTFIILYFFGTLSISPEIYDGAYNAYLENGMNEAHASNLAAVSTLFALIIGLVLMFVIWKHSFWESRYDKKAKAQNQAQDKTSSKNLSEA